MGINGQKWGLNVLRLVRIGSEGVKMDQNGSKWG